MRSMDNGLGRRRIGALLASSGALLALLFASCSMGQHVVLRTSGSGSVSFRVRISKTLMDAGNGLSQGKGAQPGQFDIAKIKKVFAKNPSLELRSIASPTPGVLAGSFDFTDIGRLFRNAPGGRGVVSFTRRATDSVLKVHLTRGDFAAVASLAGMSNNPLYQMFGPQQNAGTSPSDLNQMMVYVLGQSGPAALAASSIDVSVKLAGKVLSETGGTVHGDTVQFHIALAKLLLLARPLDYSITFS